MKLKEADIESYKSEMQALLNEAANSVEANFKKCKKKQHRKIEETASSRT